MNKTVLILSFSFLLFSAGFSQEVPEIQRSLLTKVTATWCSNCGSWGWNFFEDILEDSQGDKAVFLGAHHSGDLDSEPGAAFSTNFNAPYQPYFFFGNQNLDVTSSNMAAKRQEVKDLVDGKYLEAPLANVGLDAEIIGVNVHVDTRTLFFQPTNGDYYLGVYLLENGVINSQASQGPNASHPYVLRAAGDGGNFGLQIATGDVDTDTEVTQYFAIQLNSEFNTDSLTVIGVIWQKIDDTYHFVNVNRAESFSTSVAIIPNEQLNVDLFPTVVTDVSRLNIDLKSQGLDVDVQLFNSNGQVIQNIYRGSLNGGINSFDIDVNGLEKGIYLVSIRSKNGAVITKKLVVQ